MKIFLASAQLERVSWAADLGLVDGVLTTPQLLHDAGAITDPRELLQDLARAVRGPVIASVESILPGDIYLDGRELARLSDQVIVSVPMIEDGLASLRRLSAGGVRVCASLVFSAAQAVLAARAGASAVICEVQQLEREGLQGENVVREIRDVLGRSGLECDVIATVATNQSEFTRYLLTGADTVAVEPEGLRGMLVHPLTDLGVDRFLTSLSRLPKGRLTND